MPTLEAFANGLSATAIIVTGIALTIKMYAASRKTTSKLLGWQVIFALSLGAFFLGPFVGFWKIVFEGNSIDPALQAILCYTISPIGVVTAMYIGFTMIYPKATKPITIVYALSAIPFWANLWFDLPELSKKAVTPPALGALADIELLSWSKFFTAFYILSLVIVLGTGFLILAKQTTGDVRRRAINYALGIYMFAAAGIIDTLFAVGVWIFLVRFFMLGAYFVLYKAMVPPKPISPSSSPIVVDNEEEGLNFPL